MTQTEFTQRVLAMQDRLYRVSCTLLRCEADREDAVQSALEKAWRGRFLLRQEQYMETWLTRILINECYAIMRRSRRIIPRAEVGENQPAQWEAQNADEMLCRALTALPDTLRLPIVLHYMEGMDIRTIARTLRIRESAVKSRLHRGREKLRQYLTAAERAGIRPVTRLSEELRFTRRSSSTSSSSAGGSHRAKRPR